MTFDWDGDGIRSGNGARIQREAQEMESLTSDLKSIVVTHELGHAYGSDHNAVGCLLMKEGEAKCSSFHFPDSDDDTGVRRPC